MSSFTASRAGRTLNSSLRGNAPFQQRLARSAHARNFSRSPVVSAVAAPQKPTPRRQYVASSNSSTSAAKPAAASNNSTNTTASSPSSSSSSSHTPTYARKAPVFKPTAPAPPPPTERTHALSQTQTESPQSLTDGLSDEPPTLGEGERQIDWTRSYHGLGDSPFSEHAQATLLAPIDPDDVEVKPDGIIYLPEIKYRRILNRAFGPGAWGLAPRGESIVTGKLVTREYGLVVAGRLVSIARGEQQYFDPEGIPTATEGCKSNALMRCCKDIGIASELWDPRFIRRFIAEKTREIWVEHVVTKKKRKIWIRKDDMPRYPYQETKGFSS